MYSRNNPAVTDNNHSSATVSTFHCGIWAETFSYLNLIFYAQFSSLLDTFQDIKKYFQKQFASVSFG